MTRAYLAGPDVFLPDAASHAARKVAICRRYGIEGVPPLAEGASDWRGIFAACLDAMASCDLAIANLTPFRGASADGGTLVELGWFLGRARPIFGYTNDAAPFAARSERQRRLVPDPVPDLSVEGFGLVDNLMIDGAVEHGGGIPIVGPPNGIPVAFDDLSVFELCVEQAAERFRAHRFES